MDIKDMSTRLGHNEVTIRLDDLMEMLKQYQAVAWAEGLKAGHNGRLIPNNPYKERK